MNTMLAIPPAELYVCDAVLEGRLRATGWTGDQPQSVVQSGTKSWWSIAQAALSGMEREAER